MSDFLPRLLRRCLRTRGFYLLAYRRRPHRTWSLKGANFTRLAPGMSRRVHARIESELRRAALRGTTADLHFAYPWLISALEFVQRILEGRDVGLLAERDAAKGRFPVFDSPRFVFEGSVGAR